MVIHNGGGMMLWDVSFPGKTGKLLRTNGETGSESGRKPVR